MPLPPGRRRRRRGRRWVMRIPPGWWTAVTGRSGRSSATTMPERGAGNHPHDIAGAIQGHNSSPGPERAHHANGGRGLRVRRPANAGIGDAALAVDAGRQPASRRRRNRPATRIPAASGLRCQRPDEAVTGAHGAPMHIDDFKQQLPDIDEAETRDWVDSFDQVVGPGGREPRPVPDVQAAQARPPAPRRPAQPHPDPLHQHDQPRAGAVLPGRRGAGAPHPPADPLERRGDGPAGEHQVRGHRRPPRDLRQRGVACTRWGSTTSSGARTTRAAATRSSSRATRRPGIYARAFLEGRLTEDHLDHFRRETGGKGLSSYPHPRLMPDFWEFPTVSMGLGPLAAVYQARFNRYLQNRGIRDTSEQRVWAFLGDGEMDEPESLSAHLARGARGPRQPDLRRQLQPAAPRRPGPRQRQDHPGAGGPVPRRRLERDQGRLGPRVGRAARARHRRRARREDELDARRRVPEVVGRPTGAYVREHFFGPDPRLRKLVEHLSDDQLLARSAAAATTTARSTPRTRPRPSSRARRR